MIVSLSVEQYNRLVKKSMETKYAAHEIVETLQSIYNANFEQDIDAAIEYLEETDNEG